MSKRLNLTPVVNKNNGQINLSLSRKNLPPKLLKDIDEFKVKKIKFDLEGWE